MTFDASAQAETGRRARRRGDAPGALRWGRSLLSATRNPLEGAERAREKLAELKPRRGGPPCLEPNPAWEPALHALLPVGWPCRQRAEFTALWSLARGALERQGAQVGRGAYCGWDDADSGFARAAWCVARHLMPLTVVETGVARGLTTSMILQALEINGAGALFSIDLPPALDRGRFVDQTAAAVPDRLKRRWTLVRGSSRRRLPGLLERLGAIDLFVHDSRHSHRNMSFELTLAWSALRPGGFLLVDDVHRNTAFGECTARSRRAPWIVGASDDGEGMFGVIQKPAAGGQIRVAGTDRPPRRPGR